ncbi:hypothetical protein SAY86_030378 [Trapa natans]|uniref:DNA polymerase delta subunit 4 n=1 Tax=Trapa natans TaxID=22666 RepID=A0AAN7MFZ5_TRANT|nr:hypothetical protein SAY86_030378 [Trapa natans]
MAPKSASVKGFYRQKKNTKFIASKKVSTKKSPTHDLLELKDSCNEDEEVLMQFDMNMAYGPCLGMSRRARWERALKLGLSPPQEIESILKRGKVGSECLWEGHV